MKKKELIELIITARYGKEIVENPSGYFQQILNKERYELSWYNKLQLMMYYAFNHTDAKTEEEFNAVYAKLR